MKKVKLTLLVLTVFLVFGIMLMAYKPAYKVFIESLPGPLRHAYIEHVLVNKGFLSRESSKARLLTILVHRPDLFPPKSTKILVPLIQRYPYEPIGIMSLHIIFELNDKDIICELAKKPSTEGALVAKWAVYKKHASKTKIKLVKSSLVECLGEADALGDVGKKGTRD